jgi:hypothetical protein
MAERVTTQLALGVSITLLLAGCGNGPSSVLIAPTARPWSCEGLLSLPVQTSYLVL